MALTGSMREFGVSEIFQMIGHQKKSGTLTVKDKRREIEVLFDKGNIVGAKHFPYDDLYDLAATLERSGLAPADKVEAAKQEAQRSLRPLPQTLLAAGAVEPEALKKAVTLVHQEILYSLFLWKDGDYAFEQGGAGAGNYFPQWTEPIASEGVLMDGYRIKDEWPLVEKAIPDLNAGLERVKGGSGPESKLGPEEDRVYRLIEDGRSAMDVVFRSRSGKFETLKTVMALIDKERVQIVGQRVKAEPGAARAPLQAIALLVVALGLGSLGLGLWRNFERLTPNPHGPDAAGIRETIWALYRIDRVKAALDFFAARTGSYPDRLDQLLSTGAIEKHDLTTPAGEIEYNVSRDRKSCELKAPGAKPAEARPASEPNAPAGPAGPGG